MVAAFLLACRDTLAPEQRRSLAISLVGAALVLGGLVAVLALFLARAEPFGTAWLDVPVQLLGSTAVVALAWLLFPAATTLALGFFLDGVVRRLERDHYGRSEATRKVGVGETLRSALSLTLLSLVVNLAALPFLLWPVINLFVYYGLNGYLLGREYFELVVFRHLDRAMRQTVWRRHRVPLVTAGAIIAFLMSLPLIGLAAPLVAASFMLHLVARLEPREGPRGVAAPATYGRIRGNSLSPS